LITVPNLEPSWGENVAREEDAANRMRPTLSRPGWARVSCFAEADAIEAQGNILLMHPAGAVKIAVAEPWQGDMPGEITKVHFNTLLSSIDATLSRRPTPI